MSKYLERTQIFQPSVSYLVYNVETKEFTTNLSNTLLSPSDQHCIQIFSDDDTFSIFVANSAIDDDYFVELTTLDSAENRIYEYYGHYDVKKDKIDIVQKYSSEIIGNNIYNVTSTFYNLNSTKLKLDNFIVYHFSK